MSSDGPTSDPSPVAVTGGHPGTRIRPFSPDRMRIAFRTLRARPSPPVVGRVSLSAVDSHRRLHARGRGVEASPWELARGRLPLAYSRGRRPGPQPFRLGRDRASRARCQASGEPFPPSHVASTGTGRSWPASLTRRLCGNTTFVRGRHRVWHQADADGGPTVVRRTWVAPATREPGRPHRHRRARGQPRLALVSPTAVSTSGRKLETAHDRAGSSSAASRPATRPPSAGPSYARSTQRR